VLAEVRTRVTCGGKYPNFGNGVLDIETVNPTCIVSGAGIEDSAFAIQ